MSKEIKAKVGLLSTAPITEEDSYMGAPEGKFLVGFYLPIEQLTDFRFMKEITITVPEAKS